MADEQDINPTPEPDIPNQDALPHKYPAQIGDGKEPSDFENLLPLSQGQTDFGTPEADDETGTLLADVDAISNTLDTASAATTQPAPPLVALPESPPAPTDTGPSPDAPTSTPETPEESASDSPPELDALDEVQQQFDAYGQAVNAFNDGGGEHGIDFRGDSGDEETRDPVEQALDADLSNRSQMKDMLIEHARRLDDITRFLEAERL